MHMGDAPKKGTPNLTIHPRKVLGTQMLLSPNCLLNEAKILQRQWSQILRNTPRGRACIPRQGAAPPTSSGHATAPPCSTQT